MLQTYASDIVAAAMRMAQQQALNSFSFRDVLHLLNQTWRWCYERIAQVDAGYYSVTVPITKTLTHLPPFVMHTVLIYRATDPVGYNRQVFVEAGRKNYAAPGTYHISGQDLYCWSAQYDYVWLNYVPQPKTLFYTAFNRDPVVLDSVADSHYHAFKEPIDINKPETLIYGSYRLKMPLPNLGNPNRDPPSKRYVLCHMGNPNNLTFDITAGLYRGPDFDNVGALSTVGSNDPLPLEELYTIEAVILDWPYIFVTYKNRASGNYSSVIMKDVLGVIQRFKFNAFDFNGRGTNVKFLRAAFNDDTGLGVTIEDYDDIDFRTNKPKIKELGWTPDTLVTYPHDCIFDYMVATLAQRFANRNESKIMDIEYALAKAESELNLWLKRDKSGFSRINNVVGPRISDWL